MADVNEPQEPIANEPSEVNSPEPDAGNNPSPAEHSEVELRAMEQGWVPKDQWDGHGKWRDAEEFLDRGELFEKIDKLNRKVQNQDQVLTDLKKHHKAVKETEFKRALQALKAAKREALDEGNSELVVEIDERIAETKEAQAIVAREPVQTNDPSPPNPQLVAWVNRNKWYETERAMKIYADTVAQELAVSGERNPTKILEEVEKRVKKEFSHKFNNPNRSKPGAVEGGGAKGTSQRKDDFQLNDDERRVMNRFVKAGVMTEKEYIAELKATRGS